MTTGSIWDADIWFDFASYERSKSPEERLKDALFDNGKLAGMLAALLDQVDYTSGACRPNEMVGACVPMILIHNVKETLMLYGRKLKQEAPEE